MINYDIEVIDNLQEYLDTFPRRTRTAASLALNTVANRSGMNLLRQDILAQVAFPSGYLDDTRLGVRKLANEGDLEAVIGARSRPTSLARFTPPGTAVRLGKGSGRGSGLSVTVKPGHPTYMKGAFLLRLKAGAALDDDNFNIGLAVRLRKGEVLHNKHQMVAVELEAGVYILYGPSVDQVFASVAVEDGEGLADLIQTEFNRQFARLDAFGTM